MSNGKKESPAKKTDDQDFENEQKSYELKGNLSPKRLKIDEFPQDVTNGLTFLVFGDLHFKAKNSIDSETFIKKVTNYAKKIEGLTAVICLGDVLDGHRVIDMPSMNRAVRFFLKLSKITHVFVLIGNHDRVSNTDYITDESPFLALSGSENLTIVDSPVSCIFDEQIFLFVPFVPVGRFEEAIGENRDYTAIFAHQEFRNARNLLNQKSKSGDFWSESNPLIVSGHFHEQQTIGNNIIYIGGAFQHISHENVHKGFSVFRFNKNKYIWWFIEGIVEPTLEFTLDKKSVKHFRFPKRGRVKIVIEILDKDDFQKINSSKKVKKLRDKGAKIVYKMIENDVFAGDDEEVEKQKITFARLLKKTIQDDDRLRETLNEALDE